MTITDIPTATVDDVLAAMLTENTGRHGLDSGGAYGRNFERNAGATVDDLKARPAVHLSTWERDGKTVVSYLSLDVFHFLSERLTGLSELDAEFREFAMSPDMVDESWMECAEEFRKIQNDLRHVYGVNTYNGEDALSQVLQYEVFEDEGRGEFVVALQIHGGCDVRGGYTAPRWFTLGEEYDLADNADFDVVLTEPETSPDALAQLSAFEEFPVPTGGRSIVVSYRGNCSEQADGMPWDDPELSAIIARNTTDRFRVDLFKFDETPVTVDESGAMTIAEGELSGWTVEFHPPICS
jgi:hypothetical protein